MAGSELIGKEELAQINRLFKKSQVNLYRYGANNFLAKEFILIFNNGSLGKFDNHISF